jgi:hypothetical protein
MNGCLEANKRVKRQVLWLFLIRDDTTTYHWNAGYESCDDRRHKAIIKEDSLFE